MKSQNRIYLYPGQLTIARNNEEIWTILGSCVSIILHSHQHRVSAVCHAQLPSRLNNASCTSHCPSPCGKPKSNDYKYVTCAFKHMWGQLAAMGIASTFLEVSLYGGASQFPAQDDRLSVGQKNIATAEAQLASHGLIANHRDVGGISHRKILHHSDSGVTNFIR